jgi:hypothetical protein
MPPTLTANTGTGILSVWNDIAPDVEDFYERWYMNEHFPERLGVPGFLRGRRYAAIEADRKYFTFYDLESPQVLFSPAYLARLNAPTPWTQKIMGHWSGMFRTVCERVERHGDAVGAYVAVARWETPVVLETGFADKLHEKLADPAVVAIDLWRASPEQNAPTAEASKRPSPDRTIAGALVIEATRVASVEKAAAALPMLIGTLPAPAAIGIYGLIALQDGHQAKG